jgi:2'-5' RNA ligase
MTELLRFNLALLPGGATAKSMFETASHFRSIADGYLLHPEQALPHLTLTQFYAAQQNLPKIWARISAALPASFSVFMQGLVFRDIGEFGKKHRGHAGVWVDVKPSDDLLKIQKTAVSALRRMKINPLTASSGYEPHFTLCRCRSFDSLPKLRWPIFLPKQEKTVLSIGRSDDMGQFQEVIFKTRNKS